MSDIYIVSAIGVVAMTICLVSYAGYRCGEAMSRSTIAYWRERARVMEEGRARERERAERAERRASELVSRWLNEVRP